ncbi:uncharacterized protein IUM83_15318 [Phytophthora cinnamomi]|uniref:uncharacterized protein n=1 Tax=Phytophthora cinnamomi TaxID=4785 RepID=UPI00355AB272|nr:hypothetical protein IUM83_15318 [Phytophthora cinnamomi]
MLRAQLLRRLSAAAAQPVWRTSRSSSSSASRAALALLARPSSLQNTRRSAAYPGARSFASVGSSDVSRDLPAAAEGSTAAPLTEEERERVVALLKARCNALFSDNAAYVAPAEALQLWLHDVQALQSQLKPAQLRDEVLRAYESGVAIASKQRQFELAAALTQQMQQLGFRPTERTRQFMIRNVALQLRSGPNQTPVEDLRALLRDVADDQWEREIMRVVEREQRPLQLKTEKEFALFHERLIAGIEAQLDEYERALGLAKGSKELKTKRSTVPYNEALRVYADNGVTFSRMLQLMVARDLVVDVETYEALLLGARWNEIPATLSQLLDSKLVDELSSAASDDASAHVRTLWVNTMKAVVHSSTERFSSLSANVYKRDVDQLRKVFLFVDKKLSSAFPKFSFATTAQYDEVYTMRAKAAASCGLIAPVKRILDEYVELAPVAGEGEKPVISKEPFLAALEIFPWSLVDVMMLSRGDALARAEDREVATSPRVLEMRSMYERVIRKLTKAEKSIEEIKRKVDSEDVKLDEDELRMLLNQQNVANSIVEQESRRATTLERRLNNARVLKANQDPETRKKLTTFFEHAVCAAVRFWRDEETDALVRQQQRLLGTQQLAQREYDQLIFQRVTNLDVRGAHSLLQEMHNAGMKPSQEAIHRIALGLLHQRNASSDGQTYIVDDDEDDAEAGTSEEAGEVNDEESATAEAALDSELFTLLNASDREAIEKEFELSGALKLEGDDDKLSAESAAAARTLLLGSDAPVTIEDLIGFLQDWYNLYGVEPLGKTVVPVLARLLDANNFPEFRRLLQILESMEGGLTPATQIWLEKRLDQLGGKTLDDFRLQK